MNKLTSALEKRILDDIRDNIRKNKLRAFIASVRTPEKNKMVAMSKFNATKPSQHDVDNIVREGFKEKKEVTDKPKTEIVENFKPKKLSQMHRTPLAEQKKKILAKNDRILATLSSQLKKVKNPKDIEGVPKFVVHNNNELINQMHKQIKQGYQQMAKSTENHGKKANNGVLHVKHKTSKKFVIVVDHPLVDQYDKAKKVKLLKKKLSTCKTKSCTLLIKKLNEKPVIEVEIKFKNGNKTVEKMTTAKSNSQVGSLQKSQNFIKTLDTQIKSYEKTEKAQKKIQVKNAKIEVKKEIKKVAKSIKILKKQDKQMKKKYNQYATPQTKEQKQKDAAKRKQKIKVEKKKAKANKIIKKQIKILKKKQKHGQTVITKQVKSYEITTKAAKKKKKLKLKKMDAKEKNKLKKEKVAYINKNKAVLKKKIHTIKQKIKHVDITIQNEVNKDNKQLKHNMAVLKKQRKNMIKKTNKEKKQFENILVKQISSEEKIKTNEKNAKKKLIKKLNSPKIVQKVNKAYNSLYNTVNKNISNLEVAYKEKKIIKERKINEKPTAKKQVKKVAKPVKKHILITK